LACNNGLRAGLAALGVSIALIAPATALADGGGVSAGGGSASTAPPPTTTTAPPSTACSIGGGGVGDGTSCAPTSKAKLLPTGYAVAPADAPAAVKRAINWGNEIVNLPYRLGGGHRLPWRLDTAYDCSGTVSWALHGAHLLSSPLPSGSFARWGVPGPGRWISVYYNAGHAWMTIAGLRLDTAMVTGNGPGWSTKMSEPVTAFRVRHAPNL
jgi:cell wall-associated NlpC family hydrolase